MAIDALTRILFIWWSLRLKIAMVLYRPLLLYSSSKWCSTLVWRLIIFAYEHYCQHKVRRIMVANYRVKLKTIRWKDVTYKQDAQYAMENVLLCLLSIDCYHSSCMLSRLFFVKFINIHWINGQSHKI